MAESRPRPPPGELELDLDDFGVVDFEIESERSPPESQTRRPTPTNLRVGRATPPAMPAAIPHAAKRSVRLEEHTRVVHSDALFSLSQASTSPALDDDAPASSRSAQSESGIATRDDRVAAMRELYARGDADGALELATQITSERPPVYAPGADHPDASIYVETGEADLEDGWGGLIPVNEGTLMVMSPAFAPTFAPPPEESTVIVSVGAEEGTEAACRGMLTLTERQSIPRILKSSSELSKLPIDPRGGFLLAQVDGMQTLEEILDVCAMPAAEALELIDQLKDLGVIEFE